MQITLKVTVEEDAYGPWFSVQCVERGITREVWHYTEICDEIAQLIASEILD